MKTRITQNIDGYDIIIGIGEAQIDGVATDRIIIPMLKETAEYMAVENAKAELSKAATERYMAQKECGKINAGIYAAKDENIKKQLKLELQKASLVYQQKAIEQKEKEEALKPLAMPLIEKKKELFMANPVYFHPKQGESLITDDEATAIETAMISATENNCYVDINLKEICDNRGKTAWRKISGKWAKRDISILGDDLKAGEILQSDLSESEQLEITEQLENERISKLSAKEKEAEKTAATNSLGSQAAFMRSTLEIQGDSKALEKSKEWYNAEVEKINVKYGA